MTTARARYARNQNGYTLIEVVVASAVGAIVMAGLTSVLLTSWRASTTATSRIEASAQIRSFEFFAYDDFSRSRVPIPSGCGSAASPCTTQPIVLYGWQVTNPATSAAPAYQVTYAWDGSQFVDRLLTGGTSLHAATGVTAFSWYVDSSTPHPTVVINMTITVDSYQESQTLRFLPQVML